MPLRLTGIAVLFVTAALASGAAGFLITEASNLTTDGPASPQRASHHPGGMDAMSIDMNVAGNSNAALGSIETCARVNENDLVDGDEQDILALSRTAAGATATTLADSAGGWLADQWVGNRVVITAGIGSGQTRLISSNTANTLTVTEAWNTVPGAGSPYEIRLNDAIRVDATAQGIPALNNAGTPSDPRDDTGGIIAYELKFNYPAAVTVAAHTYSQPGVTILTRNAGSSAFDGSHSTPDADGLFVASVIDLGSGIPESGSGVLSRFVLQSSPAAGTAVHALGLSANVHVDAAGGVGYAPDATYDNAFVAINATCPPADIDGDGWSDAAEAIIGTDALDNCADDAAHNAWPADINNNGFSDTADLTTLTGNFGKSVPPAPSRANISPDPPNGFVDTADIAGITRFFGAGCDP
jgi:hypothetical protein